MRILDNGGKTTDRYTIILGKRYDEAVYIMSENALSPQGVNMFLGYEGESGIDHKDCRDKEITLSDLPKEVLIAIINRIEQ